MKNKLMTVAFILVMTGISAFKAQAQNYCENGSYSNFAMWIDSVRSDPFEHYSGQFNNQYGDQDHLYIGYADYSQQVIAWQAGPNQLEIVPGRYDHPFMDDYPSYWQVWIDLNADSIFGSDERVYAGQTFSNKVDEVIDLSTFNLSGTITTRMRISVSFYEDMPPCGSIGEGEVEDYTVEISPPANNTWLVPEQFITIQSAVDAAAAGDRVLVNDGVYYESILVDKALMIESVNGADVTVVSGNDHLYTFDVQSPDVSIKGFAVENLAANSMADIYFAPGADRGLVLSNRCADLNADAVQDRGVYIDEADYVRVDGLVCETEGFLGIHSSRANGGHFANNSISYQSQGGIYVSRAESVVIENNTTQFNARAGIDVFTLADGLITGNTSNFNVDSDDIFMGGNGISVYRAENLVINNNQTLDNDQKGIRVALSENVEVTDNMANGNTDGIHSGGNTLININYNTINENTGDGLAIYSTDEFEANANELLLNGDAGLTISRSQDGQVGDNQVAGNYRALSLRESSSVRFTANAFQAGEGMASTCQVTLYQASFNRFALNSFLMMGPEICSDQTSSNQWESAVPLNYNVRGVAYQNFLGNYFLDGDHTDNNGDAIADNSFLLPGSGQADDYPLVVPARELDIQ